MKKPVYFFLLLSIAMGSYFYFTKKDESVTPAAEKKIIQEETIEERAYRVETTARKAPEQLDEVSKEIWDLNEEMRIAQAKIRIRSKGSSEKFRKDWQLYKRENQVRIGKIRSLHKKKAAEHRKAKLMKQFGENSAQVKNIEEMIGRDKKAQNK